MPFNDSRGNFSRSSSTPLTNIPMVRESCDSRVKRKEFGNANGCYQLQRGCALRCPLFSQKWCTNEVLLSSTRTPPSHHQVQGIHPRISFFFLPIMDHGRHDIRQAKEERNHFDYCLCIPVVI